MGVQARNATERLGILFQSLENVEQFAVYSISPSYFLRTDTLKVLIPEMYLNKLQIISFLLRNKHFRTAFPFFKQAGQYCLGKSLLFIVRHNGELNGQNLDGKDDTFYL